MAKVLWHSSVVHARSNDELVWGWPTEKWERSRGSVRTQAAYTARLEVQSVRSLVEGLEYKSLNVVSACVLSLSQNSKVWKNSEHTGQTSK